MRRLPVTDDVLAGKNPAWDYNVQPAVDSEQAATNLLRNPPAMDEVVMPSTKVASGEASLEEAEEYVQAIDTFMNTLNPVAAAYAFTVALGYNLETAAKGITRKSSLETKAAFNTAYDNTLTWVATHLPEEFLILFIRCTLAIHRLPVDPHTPAFQKYAQPLESKILAA